MRNRNEKLHQPSQIIQRPVGPILLYVAWIKHCGILALSQNCEKQLLASSYLFVLPSVRMIQLGSHWTYFCEILYLCIFRKSFQKTEVSLKSDTKHRHCTCRPSHLYGDISTDSSQNEKCFRQICTENQNTHFTFTEL